MLYRKIFKWLLVCLFVVGVITSAFGFINGWPETKKWANDQKLAEELPVVIEDLKVSGAEELTKAELDEKKAEIDALTVVAKEKLAASNAITETIEKAKGSKKTRLEKEYAPVLDSLSKEILAINGEISKYNLSRELLDNQTQLNEVEERIATGNSSVNTILYSTYVMFVIAIVALFIVIFVITGMNSPMGLVKILVGVVIIGAIVYGAWALAPGSELHPAEYYRNMGTEAPAAGDLKMTDTVLYLAYLLVGGTAVALLTSWVVGAIRK